jgi:hypothetical protein
MNFFHKRNILHDIIQFNKIDIVPIQEIKKKDFSKRMLRNISSSMCGLHYLL